MKRYAKKHIIAKLKHEGLTFSEFSVVHEGNYTVEDADWNYKDVPHLHHIHELVEAVFTSVDDDYIATINMQKVLGLKLPLAVFNYQTEPNVQTYYTTWFFFVLIVETRYDQLAPIRTRVTTTYSIGSPKLLKWTFPLLRWVLKRNYDNLMSGDIPMRERRGQLRAWGYRFKKDNAFYSFEDTMDIKRSNVIPPTGASDRSISVDINETLPSDGEVLIGESDHRGLRLVRNKDELFIFPRMCLHEGACLDRQTIKSGTLNCPWHGRQVTPIAIFDLSSNSGQEKIIGNRFFKFNDGRLSSALATEV